MTSLVRTGEAVDSYYKQYSARLKSVRSSSVQRLVGYFEYMRALALLTPLVNQSSADELAVYEEIVKERDELVIYSNLSRRLERGPSTLAEKAAAGHNFRQHGLAWLMALARVEVGAMAAGFTQERHPFALIPPTRYELLAYQEMLLDGFRTHYAALKNDPAVQFYWSFKNAAVTLNDRVGGRRNVNQRQAIAYARRAAIAREFGQAAMGLGAGRLAAAQQAELKSKVEEINELESIILYKVLALGRSAHSGSSKRQARQVLGRRTTVENRSTGRARTRTTGASPPRIPPKK